jgi:hypothetical protein
LRDLWHFTSSGRTSSSAVLAGASIRFVRSQSLNLWLRQVGKQQILENDDPGVKISPSAFFPAHCLLEPEEMAFSEIRGLGPELAEREPRVAADKNGNIIFAEDCMRVTDGRRA